MVGKADEFNQKAATYNKLMLTRFHKFQNNLVIKALNSKKKNAATLDLLAVKQDILYLACIWSNDGKEDHCIAVYGDWIFDSNFPKALRLTKDSLDLCCSSEAETT
jgi:hypothetical protein